MNGNPCHASDVQDHPVGASDPLVPHSKEDIAVQIAAERFGQAPLRETYPAELDSDHFSLAGVFR
jgi:hypothetical protein